MSYSYYDLQIKTLGSDVDFESLFQTSDYTNQMFDFDKCSYNGSIMESGIEYYGISGMGRYSFYLNNFPEIRINWADFVPEEMVNDILVLPSKVELYYGPKLEYNIYHINNGVLDNIGSLIMYAPPDSCYLNLYIDEDS